jgi:hypothetical protein
MFTRDSFSAGHQYKALSWNRNSKPEITIENRLNEAHPYWSIPFMHVLSTIDAACIERGKSIKLDDHHFLEKSWANAFRDDVYKAMLKMTGVEFTMPDDRSDKSLYRGIPYLCESDPASIAGDDLYYPTALDVFRRLTKRFAARKGVPSTRFSRVMRMWSDFIDFSKLPSHLVWDVDGLYKMLYESDTSTSREYQDKFLYHGSSVVSDDDDEKWISELI